MLNQRKIIFEKFTSIFGNYTLSEAQKTQWRKHSYHLAMLVLRYNISLAIQAHASASARAWWWLSK